MSVFIVGQFSTTKWGALFEDQISQRAQKVVRGERAEEENARIYIDRQSADLISLLLMSSLFAKRLIAKTEPTFPHFAIAIAIDTTAFQTSNSLMRIEEELKKEKSDLKESLSMSQIKQFFVKFNIL